MEQINAKTAWKCKCKDIRIVILRKDDHPLYLCSIPTTTYDHPLYLCSIPTTTLSLQKNDLDNNQQNYIINKCWSLWPKSNQQQNAKPTIGKWMNLTDFRQFLFWLLLIRAILLISWSGVSEIVRFVMSSAISPYTTSYHTYPTSRQNLKHKIINNTELLH